MDVFQSIVLGLVQGITECLPISSSAHLIIVPSLFGWEKHALLFDIVLHMGTFFAIVIYFRKDWIAILREGILSIRERSINGQLERRLFWYIFAASIPGVILGGVFATTVEDYFRNPIGVAGILGLFGLVLYAAEVFGAKRRSLAEITLFTALLIGLSQAVAIIPGVSRSGITISAALALGMNRESSARFSFLLAAPIMFAAACYSVGKPIISNFTALSGHLFTGDMGGMPWAIVLAGFIASFLSGIIAIHFLFRFIKRYSFTGFALYRLVLSSAVLIMLFRR